MNQTLTTLRPGLKNILALLPMRDLGISDAMEDSALDEIHAQLLRVGLDALTASTSRISFSEAAQDRENFPFLRRFHCGVTDILQWTIPRELLPLFEKLMAGPPIANSTLESLTRIALSPDTAPAEAALLRFLVFEAIRLTLVVVAWREEKEFTDAGARLKEIDAIAEKQLDRLVKNVDALGPEDRPLQMLVALGMNDLLLHVDELKTTLLQIKTEVADPVRIEVRQAQFEARLRSMELTDAVLLGNRYAGSLDEQRLPVELLQQDHPVALKDMSRAAMDQRVKRLADTVEKEKGVPERRGTALIDLVKER
jgi:hypothetical protein